MITDAHVKQMKRRLKIFHDGEDDHIESLLEDSFHDLSERCGFDDLSDVRAKELVFERTRYAYNDSLEFFHENFLSMITVMAIKYLDVSDNENI